MSSNKLKLPSSIYVVTAYKWGINSEHSYVVGVFDTRKKAIDCADKHTKFTKGKYSCEVDKCFMNDYDQNETVSEYSELIYKTKANRDERED